MAIAKATGSAGQLRSSLKLTGWFDCIDLSDHSVELQGNDNENIGRWEGLPVVAFSLAAHVRTRCPELTETGLSKALFAKGFSVPCRPPESRG